jgi:pimeloyl-ACP methyl ester carboxylesterase
MSDDQIIALNNLGLHSVNVMGISQGGMIAQQMAVSYPYMVKKLVIVVSCFQVHRNAQISLKPLD